MHTTRFIRLLAAGLIDSFGMTLGWTVFSLLALELRPEECAGV